MHVRDGCLDKPCVGAAFPLSILLPSAAPSGLGNCIRELAAQYGLSNVYNLININTDLRGIRTEGLVKPYGGDKSELGL